jgi:hypothetical protein
MGAQMSGHLTITIEEIPELRESLDRFTDAVDRFVALRGLTKAWYTEQEACSAKNLPYNTLRQQAHRRYLPNFGRRTEVFIKGGHQWMYSRDQVAAWLPLTYDEIDRMWEQERLRDHAG